MNGSTIDRMHPGDQVADAMTRIYDMGLTTTSGGNISIRDPEGNIWITPAAVDKGTLRRENIVCMRPDGSRTGKFVPSSEFPFHRAIYDARPDLNAILHAHPCSLVSFSIVRKRPDTKAVPLSRRICGEVGYADYALPGSGRLGKKIAGEFEKGHNCVLMENHGAVIGGESLADAFTRFETFEFTARTLINAHIIDDPAILTDEQIDAFESGTRVDLAESDLGERTEREKAISEEISQLVRRSCRQGMMISSSGNASVRCEGNDFLITPRDLSRPAIGAGDVVRIRSGEREKGKHPSRAVSVHQAIYEANPHVNSIISSRPPNLMAFAVAGMKPEVRTIPESWIFLQDIPLAAFGSPYAKREEFAAMFRPDRPAVLVENDCIFITGDELLQTFDRLEVAEFSARSLVKARSLGGMVPIDDQQVEELRKAFLSQC